MSVFHGKAKSRLNARKILRVKKDGKFKIVQIFDTHMVINVGICENAIDAHKNNLLESEADLFTIDFIEKILNVEKPDFVVFIEDQLHHDIFDN